MYAELVKRLRRCASYDPRLVIQDCEEAADAIEELQAQLMYSNDAAKAIAEKVPKWIPVSERLPEDDVFVLNCNDHGNIVIGKIIGGTWWYKYFSYQGQVTHWMPLPEAPKEET